MFKASGKRVNPRIRTLKSVYKTHIDAVHFRLVDQHQQQGTTSTDRDQGAEDDEGGETVASPTRGDNQGAGAGAGSGGNGSNGNGTDGQSTAPQFSSARIREFKEFVRDGRSYEKLVQAFAPSIWEMNDVKRGLLCLLFGCTLAEVQETSRKRRRRGLAGGQGLEGEGEGLGHGLNQSMVTDDDGEMGKSLPLLLCPVLSWLIFLTVSQHTHSLTHSITYSLSIILFFIPLPPSYPLLWYQG